MQGSGGVDVAAGFIAIPGMAAKQRRTELARHYASIVCSPKG